MQAELETLGQLERRLSIAVPMAEIDSEVETRLKRLSRTVKMAGFRPGRVPFKVIVQQYGPQVRQEVLGATLEKSFGEALRERNLRVAGYPKFEAKPPVDGAAEFHYSATFEVYPEIKIGDVSQAKIARPQLVVGDAEVDRTIEIMRKQRTVYESVERAAENGDRVTISYRGTIDGAEFQGGSAENQPVVLGGGRLLPDFENALTGIKGGESRAFDLRFPDDYHGKDVAGKTARFEVTASEVAAPRLPDLDAEFAKQLGVADGDLAKMRAEVKANLEREVGARLKTRARDRAMQALLDLTGLEPPKSLVELEIQELQRLTQQDLAARGMQVKEGMPLPGEVFEAQAKRRVSLGLILAEIVKSNGLQAKPEQVKAAVEELAQGYERPEEVVRWFYQSPDRLRDVESRVVEENVVAWVLATARVEDEAIAFDELMDRQT